jgi:V/A-type H+-transporting ATPase subunit I
MFFPKAMSEIELIVPAPDLLRVTRILSGHGVFHQAETSLPGGQEDRGSDGSWQERATAYAALERRIQVLMQNLGIAEAPMGASDFPDIADPEQLQKALDRIEVEAKMAMEQLAEAVAERDRLRNDRQQLEPLAGIDLKVSALRDSRFLFPMLGMMPASNVARLQTSLARVPHLVFTLKEDAHKPVVWIAGTHANRDIVERAARSAYFEPLSLPLDYEGSPSEVIGWLDSEIAKVESRLQKHERSIEELGHRHAGDLLRLAWEVHASRTLTEAIVRFGRLRHTYVIVGWVPTADLQELVRRIRETSKETIIETTRANRAGDGKRVPVALQSSKLLRPFQQLVTTYARPRYGEVDPTWLIALTFPLLFGAMFGDVGHGLLLAALGVLLSARKVKALRSLASLGGLITVCGLVAAAFGFLYGSIFGFEHVLHAAWLQPGEDPLTILVVAIGAGVVLLSIGFLIGIFNGIVSRDWGHLLFGHSGIAAAALYWSLLGLGAASAGLLAVPAKVFGVIALAAGTAIMFSSVLIRLAEGERPLVEGGIGTYAIQAPMELFETVISYLSNSLSYVRVGAFAIAHVVLSSVVFLLAELVSPHQGIGYWVIVTVGNIGIVLYEGLIVGIQAMRLSYYEFFSKFFTGGGMRFEPLGLPSRQDA